MPRPARLLAPHAPLAALVALAACAGGAGEGSRGDLAASAPAVSSAPPGADAGPLVEPPTPSASAKASAPAPRPHAAKLVSFELTGARVAAASLAPAGPRIAACADAAAPASFAGWLTLRADVKPGGALAGLRADDGPGLGPALGSCVEKALAGLVLEGEVKPGAKLVMHASVRPAEPSAPPLPALDPHEVLRRVDGGVCRGMTDHECPPRKICQAPTQRDVACPEGHGLPPPLDWLRADKRLHLAIGGGKTGQRSESVELGRQGATCAVHRVAGDGADPLSPSQSEELDVACAEVEAVWALAQKKLAGASPKGRGEHAHLVSRRVTFTTRSGGGPQAAAVRAWVGESPVDEAFTEVARAATKLGGARATLRLPRLE